VKGASQSGSALFLLVELAAVRRSEEGALAFYCRIREKMNAQ
jgi:hypothetical protein